MGRQCRIPAAMISTMMSMNTKKLHSQLRKGERWVVFVSNLIIVLEIACLYTGEMRRSIAKVGLLILFETHFVRVNEWNVSSESLSTHV